MARQVWLCGAAAALALAVSPGVEAQKVELSFARVVMRSPSFIRGGATSNVSTLISAFPVVPISASARLSPFLIKVLSARRGPQAPSSAYCRKRDMRRLIFGTLFVLAVSVPTGCGAGDAPPGREAAAVPSGSGDMPPGMLFLRHVREQSITRIDLASGESTTVSLPQLVPGDPPFHLVATGGRLVFYGGSHTYSLDPDLKSPPQDLGESWYFVPSAREGRVWLTTLDPESPETVRDLKAVQEVTVDGAVTVPETGRPPSRGPTVLAAVNDGLLFQEHDELKLWDPLAEKVTARLSGPFPADTHGNLVAWCAQGCPKLHITDVATGQDVAVSPSPSFRFEETYDGDFSPDGALLAVPAVTSRGRARSTIPSCSSISTASAIPAGSARNTSPRPAPMPGRFLAFACICSPSRYLERASRSCPSTRWAYPISPSVHASWKRSPDVRKYCSA
jgi:hypothetical protein